MYRSAVVTYYIITTCAGRVVGRGYIAVLIALALYHRKVRDVLDKTNSLFGPPHLRSFGANLNLVWS